MSEERGRYGESRERTQRDLTVEQMAHCIAENPQRWRLWADRLNILVIEAEQRGRESVQNDPATVTLPSSTFQAMKEALDCAEDMEPYWRIGYEEKKALLEKWKPVILQAFEADNIEVKNDREAERWLQVLAARLRHKARAALKALEEGKSGAG